MQENQKQQRKRATTRAYLGIGVVFAIFVAVSYIINYTVGIEIGKNSWHFLRSMLLLFPAAFILIGLFDVWIDRSVVERHLGSQSGLLGYFWVILLATTVLAPMIVALPIAHSLSKKGAKLQLLIAFISASTICRIPMAIFEASYLGIPFSAVRLLVSIPLVIIFSEIIGRIFSNEELPA